jgi:hypothetical protein
MVSRVLLWLQALLVTLRHVRTRVSDSFRREASVRRDIWTPQDAQACGDPHAGTWRAPYRSLGPRRWVRPHPGSSPTLIMPLAKH